MKKRKLEAQILVENAEELTVKKLKKEVQIMGKELEDQAVTPLNLVQTLRLSTASPERKIDFACKFVESQKAQMENGQPEGYKGALDITSGWMKMPQVVSFLSEWVQSALIKSAKPGLSSKEDELSGLSRHSDLRYWSILKYCLFSGYLHRNTSIHPSLMRSLAATISSTLTQDLILELNQVLKILLTDYERPFRSNLDGWVSLVGAVLDLLNESVVRISSESSSIMILVNIVLDCFSRTLISHPNPRKLYQAVVARLLEPLLVLIGNSVDDKMLVPRDDRKIRIDTLSKVAEDIISNGLFHPAHVGGYYEVCAYLKGLRDTNFENQAYGKKEASYHRMFFQKLDQLRIEGNYCALRGLGRLFKVYALKLKAQRAAITEDIFGVRGEGKPQTIETNTDNKHDAGGEIKFNSNPAQENDSEMPDKSLGTNGKKQSRGSDALFTVLAELLGPLTLDLRGAASEETQTLVTQLGKPQRMKIWSLMTAVNELLDSAKEAHAYKSIEDTLSLTYFKFLQEVYNSISKAGKVAFDIWSNDDAKTPVTKKKKRLSGVDVRIETRKEIGVLSVEVLCSLQYLLDLEYRVFEQELSQIWLFVLRMTALDSESGRTTVEALKFGRGLLNVYSDLRQVDIPIFFLVDTVTSLHAAALQDGLFTSVTKLVCAKTFLVTLGSVMHKLPDGQVPSILKKLTTAVTKTLNLFENNENLRSSWSTEIFGSSLKGVLELFTCLLENVNITPANSVLAGGAVRELLLKVLCPPLTKLVDDCTQVEDNVEGSSDSNVDLLAWRSLILLTLYSTSRTLHRQCLSLMPPKAAKKASGFEPGIDFGTVEDMEVITTLKECNFLTSLQRGSVKLSNFLRRLGSKIGSEGLLRVPGLGFTLNCIALRSLVDLDRNAWAAKFLHEKAGSKKFSKICRSLDREGAKLVTYMLGGLECVTHEDDVTIRRKWDTVTATLTSDTLCIARWNLICQTTDIWSKYSSEEELKNFTRTLLHIGGAFEAYTKASGLLNKAEEEIATNCTEEVIALSLKGITADLLANLEFYENEAIRKVFASSFLEELKAPLLSILEDDVPLFGDIDLCIGTTASFLPTVEDVVYTDRLKLEIGASMDTNCSTRQKDSSWSEAPLTDFDQFIGLLKLLAYLPRGYLFASDVARCAYTVSQLERFLVVTLLNHNLEGSALQLSGKREKTTCFALPSRPQLIAALAACRSALDCLASSLTTIDVKPKTCEFMDVVFGSTTRSQKLTLLPQAAALCLIEDVSKHETSPSTSQLKSAHQVNARSDGDSPYRTSTDCSSQDSSNVSFALLKRTCGIIESTLGRLCNSQAKSLLCTKLSLNAPTLEASEVIKGKSKKFKGPVAVFGKLLIDEAHNVENFLKNSETPVRWFGPLVTVASINTFLWGMTKALEGLDEECRNSKSTPLVWKTDLPEAWLHVIKELEPTLVRVLLHILFPSGAAGLQFFTKTSTQTTEYDDVREVDAVGDQIFEEYAEAVSIKDDGEGEDKDLESSSDEDLLEEDVTGEQNQEGVSEDEDQEMAAMFTEQNFPGHRKGTEQIVSGTTGESVPSRFSSLQSIMEETVGEKSEFVGELFMAMAALVKLRSLFSSPFAVMSEPLSSQLYDLKHGSPPSLNTLLLAAYWFISASIEFIQTQKPLDIIWLVGVVKFLESVGAFLPSMKPFIFPLDYVKLINLHLTLIGALLLLRKDSKFIHSPNDIDSIKGNLGISDWDFTVHESVAPEGRSSENASSYHLEQLESALRRSFERFLKYAPRQHMVLALQSVEKAMAGVWEGSIRGSGLEVSGVGSCQVGPVIAAGVDCLALSLQAVSGKMRLHLLASHCPTFFGALFNLIGHLQGPSLFFGQHQGLESHSERLNKVNAAPVVLHCVEILNTLASRAVIFPMKACNVVVALETPAILFRPFCGFGKPRTLLLQESYVRAEYGNSRLQKREYSYHGFNGMSVKLYVGCCKLLSALLRHRLRECGHSMALLGESARVLLQCLTTPCWTEFPDNPSVSSVASATHCGSWLRRVYEELGEHKETLGIYCSHILADYLNVISGYGSTGVGLHREVDRSLRSGAYALLDACSANDLQQLHAALGEGGRRSALMTLRSDYDLHYKYTGKV